MGAGRPNDEEGFVMEEQRKMVLVHQDLEEQKEALDRDRDELRSANAQMDVEIAKGQEAVTRLQTQADAMEDENARKRRENEAMREKIRRMKERLAQLESK